MSRVMRLDRWCARCVRWDQTGSPSVLEGLVVSTIRYGITEDYGVSRCPDTHLADDSMVL